MKKLVIIILIAFTAVLSTGCAEINVYSYYSDGVLYNDVEIGISQAIITQMEANAITRYKSEETWTVQSYLNMIMEEEGYTFVSKSNEDKVYFYYSKAYSEDELTHFQKLNLDNDQSEEIIDKGFFVYEINIIVPNPFNGARQAYDNASGNSQLLMDRLKHGTSYPAITEIFPTLKQKDLDSLMLNFYWQTDSKFAANNGELYKDSDGNNWYLYSKNFDSSKDYIKYTYIRPNPVGWYVTAIICGVAVCLIIYFITRKKSAGRIIIQGQNQNRPIDTNQPINPYDTQQNNPISPYDPEQYPDLIKRD